MYPGIPFFINGVPAFLQVMDRDVILARADVHGGALHIPARARRLTVNDRNNVPWTAATVIDLPLGALGSVQRGFVAVDATVGGALYRFVNTHLEGSRRGPIPGEFQAAQAYQLLDTVAYVPPAPGRRLVIVGDMNSVRPTRFPDGAARHPSIVACRVPAYTHGSFTDIWTSVREPQRARARRVGSAAARQRTC